MNRLKSELSGHFQTISLATFMSNIRANTPYLFNKVGYHDIYNMYQKYGIIIFTSLLILVVKGMRKKNQKKSNFEDSTSSISTFI